MVLKVAGVLYENSNYSFRSIPSFVSRLWKLEQLNLVFIPYALSPSIRKLDNIAVLSFHLNPHYKMLREFLCTSDSKAEPLLPLYHLPLYTWNMTVLYELFPSELFSVSCSSFSR